jgi:hypothetical protein
VDRAVKHQVPYKSGDFFTKKAKAVPLHATKELGEEKI